MVHFLLVFVGGGIGAAGRHAVSQLAARIFGNGFPVGTLTVNVAGSFAMGLLVGWLMHRAELGGASGNVSGNENMRLFFATGLLGGFTTFSAFSLDVAHLWQKGAGTMAFGYVVSSVFVCIAAVFAGLWLTRSISA